MLSLEPARVRVIGRRRVLQPRNGTEGGVRLADRVSLIVVLFTLPAGNSEEVYGGGEDTDRSGRVAGRDRDSGAVPSGGNRTNGVLPLVEGIPGRGQMGAITSPNLIVGSLHAIYTRDEYNPHQRGGTCGNSRPSSS